MYTVYMYTNIQNGKIYIGRTKNTLEQRAQTNGCNYKNCTDFYKAIQEYGWESFQPTILKECETVQEANQWEKYYIQEYDSMNPNIGYNIEHGGNDGPQSEKTRKKISENAKERYTDPTKNPNYGKHWNDDFKQKMREQFSGEGGYWYGTHVSEERKQYLSSLFKGTHKTIRKKPWTPEELEEKKRQMKENSKMWSKKVRCIDDDILFDTITEAAAYVDRHVSSLSEALRKGTGKCGGKYFEFAS